jgi:hypothetical protein
VCLTGTWNASQTVGRELSQYTLVPHAASPAPSATASAASSTATASPAALPSTDTAIGNGVPAYGWLALVALAVAGIAFVLIARARRA